MCEVHSHMYMYGLRETFLGVKFHKKLMSMSVSFEDVCIKGRIFRFFYVYFA